MKTTLPHTNEANRPVLLLTAAVDARNGDACLFSKQERYTQYLHAFRWYMRFLQKNPTLCRGLVFCENSEADLSEFHASVPPEWKDRVEFISLSMEGFRPEKGKTYNEMRTLDLSLKRSALIGPDNLFVKLTGRYPVRNIRRMVLDLTDNPSTINLCYFRDTYGYEHQPLAETRCIAFRRKTWDTHFRGLFKTADNATKRHFETIVLEVVDKNHDAPGWIEGFSNPPFILGKQGHVKRIKGIPLPKWIEPLYLVAAWLYQKKRHAAK